MKKVIFILGNPLLENDSLPVAIKPLLIRNFPDFEFKHVDPSEGDEISGNPVIIDTVIGIKKIRVFKNLTDFQKSPRNSVHDYDLHLYLGLMLKLKKISSFTIIGIPEKYTVKKAFLEVSKKIRGI